MGQAAIYCASGSGDPLLAAKLMDISATLKSSQRDFAGAFRLLDSAFRLYSRIGETHLAGRALISKGIYTGYANNSEEAITLLQRGLAMIDRQRDPGLELAAKHGLAWWLVDLGHFRQARVLLFNNRALYISQGAQINWLRLRWLEGRISAGLGDLARAETAFRQVREGFVSNDLPYKQALVSLDLAMVLMRQGRDGEVLALVKEMVQTFSVLGIEREAYAAILVLREMAEREMATLDLLQIAAGILKSLEHGPFSRPESSS